MKNVTVNGTTYNGIDTVRLNTTNGGTATFIDAEELHATESGRVIHVDGAGEVTALKLYNSGGTPISSATIAVTNKNIFRADLIQQKTVSQGITYVKNNDGSFTASGTSTGTYASASCQMDKNAFEVGKTYTISTGKTSGELYVQLTVNYTDGTTDYIVGRNSPRTFTITKAVTSVTGSVQITNSGITLNGETIYPQVEIAGAASLFAKNVYSSVEYDGSTMPTLPDSTANLWPISSAVASMTVQYSVKPAVRMDTIEEKIAATSMALEAKAETADFYTKDEINQMGNQMYRELVNKDAAVEAKIPTSVSQLENDRGYITKDTNTTYELSKEGNAITLTGSDGAKTTVYDTDTTYGEATDTQSGLMSPGYKAKIDRISEAAEENQDAFTNVKVGTTTITAGAKSDTFTIVAGDNVTATANATNKTITISATDTNTVTSVKGNAETTYRTGQVNITPANIGLGNVNNTADSAKSVASAEKATKDAAGNTITTTYATKTELAAKQAKITAGTETPSGGNDGDIYIQYL